MKHLGARVALVAGSAALLGIGLVSIGGATPSAAPPAAGEEVLTPPTSDYAFEAVGADGDARVAYYKDVGSDPLLWGAPTEAVPLELNRQCVVTNLDADATPDSVDTVGDLLEIAVVEGETPLDVQLINNGIGSKGTGRCSRNAGRVLQGQEMVLSVGQWLRNQGLGFATENLNVEAKFGASLDVAFNGSPTFNTVPLTKSDNGPDSGNGDNNFEKFTQLAFSMTIRPTPGDGEISLESGGDGPLDEVPFTYFELAEVVDCDAGLTVENDNVSESTDEVTFIRKENKYDVPCAPINVDITFGFDTSLGDVVTIVPGTNIGEDPLGELVDVVRAEVIVTWSVERFKTDGTPKTNSELDLELSREIQYPNPKYDPADPSSTEPEYLTAVDVVYCEGLDGNGDPKHPAGQAWCLLDDTRETSEDDPETETVNEAGQFIIQTMRLDINGDPRMF